MYRVKKLIETASLLLALSIFSSNTLIGASRDDAYLYGNYIVIPKAIIGNAAYYLELALKINGNDYEFSLIDFSEIQTNSQAGASSFEDLSLNIPKLVVSGVTYELNLMLVSSDPVTFRLVDFSKLATEGLTAEELFESTISKNIITSKCALCHNKNGVASTTGLLFGQSSLSTDYNYGIIKNFLVKKDSNTALILSKVIGEMHGGGTQLPTGSQEFEQFKSFVELIRADSSEKIEVAEDIFGGVIFESKLKTLRRAAVLFAGRIPNDKEIESVTKGDSTILRSEIRNLMQGNGFRDFIVRGVNDRLLTESTVLNFDSQHFPVSSQKARNIVVNNENYYQKLLVYQAELGFGARRSVGELANYIAQNERSYKEFVTADYMMMNPVLAEAMGARIAFNDISDFQEFKPGTIQEYYHGSQVSAENCNEAPHGGCDIVSLGNPTVVPLSGVLTDRAFLDRYPTTPTNRNRARAKQIFLHFLGIDIEKSAERPLDKESLTDTNNPTLNNPNCSVCHEVLDPVAGALQNWGVVGRYLPFEYDALPVEYKKSELYRNGDRWYRDMRSPGLLGQSITDERASAQQLGQLIAEHPNFASAAVRFWWESVFGIKMISAPSSPENADYAERLAAYSAQEDSIKKFAANFSRGFNLKDLLVDMIDSPWFSLDQLPADNPLNAQTSQLLGNERLLTPEELSTKIHALTGLQWRIQQQEGSLPKNGLTSKFQYKLMYGGIDSQEKVIRDRLLTPVMLTTALSLAAEMSCSAVMNEFSIDQSSRMLFAQIDQYTIPKTLNHKKINLQSVSSDEFIEHSMQATLAPNTKSIGVTLLDGGTGALTISSVEVVNLITQKVEKIPLLSLSGNRYCYAKNSLYWMGGLCTFEIPYESSTETEIRLNLMVSLTTNTNTKAENRSILVSSLAEKASQNSLSGAVRRIKTQIQSLLSTMHGNYYELDSDTINAYYELFNASLAEKEQSSGYRLDACGPAIDFTAIKNLSQTSDVYQVNEGGYLSLNYDSSSLSSLSAKMRYDPLYTKTAWAAVFFAMMSDYDFLVE
ncbi:DUF1588 domain-containing protein [Gammaproteobacteria bacterium]|nr:DUF1588 domain-containing protein [Gammaproteobacteria bacterium]